MIRKTTRARAARMLAWVLALALLLPLGGQARAAGNTYVLQSSTTDYGYGPTTTSYTYNARGLAQTMTVDDETIQIRYRYDEQGAPVSLILSEPGEEETVEVALENSCNDKGTVTQVLIREPVVDGEAMELEDDWEAYTLWTMLLPMLRYAPVYRNAAFIMEGTENRLTLSEGKEVYSCTVRSNSYKHETITDPEQTINRVYHPDEDGWALYYESVTRMDTRGRVVQIDFQRYDEDQVTVVSLVDEYIDLEDPKSGESASFGSILNSTESAQIGLEHMRYYYDADGNLTRWVLFTPSLDASYQNTTTREYAPDGTLTYYLQESYRDGELQSRTEEIYVPLWEAAA